MARVLLVDDDRALLDVLSLALEEAGHRVSVASDGAAGLALLESDGAELLVLDVNMPRVDGFTVVKRLRAAGRSLPILLLTSRDDEVDEALGFELGADDYVIKPFSTRVLLARIQALLRRDEARRAPVQVSEEPALRIDGLAIDMARMEVRYRETPIVVTVTEIRLLEALALRPGIVLGRDQLLERARGDDGIVGARLVDTYVRRLRRKLEAVDASFDRIETVVGAGYRWRSG